MFEVLFHIDLYEQFHRMLYSTYNIRGYYEYAINKTGDEYSLINVYIPHFRAQQIKATLQNQAFIKKK